MSSRLDVPTLPPLQVAQRQSRSVEAGMQDTLSSSRSPRDSKGQSRGWLARKTGLLSCAAISPPKAFPDADLVLISVPAFAHREVLERVRPYLKETAAVGCLPTRGGFEFEALRSLFSEGAPSRRSFFGLQTFPWSARVRTPGRLVHFGAAKTEVLLAATGGDAVTMATELTQMLGVQIVARGGFLALTLGNPGQFIHPGLMYGHFRSWQGGPYDARAVPRFYADATDEMGDVVEQLSQEAIAVAQAFPSYSDDPLGVEAVKGVHDWLRSTYAHVTADTATVGSCFRTGPIQARLAPMNEVAPGKFMPNFTYRYLSEDVPFGLVVTKGLGNIAGVRTPTIDEVILWAQAVTGKEYLRNGRLNGMDARHLPIPQNYGFHSHASLDDWYLDLAAGHPQLQKS